MKQNFPYLPGDKFKAVSMDFDLYDTDPGDELFCIGIEKSRVLGNITYSFINIRNYKLVIYKDTELISYIDLGYLSHIPRTWSHSIPKTLFCESLCPMSGVCSITDCPIEGDNSNKWNRFYLPGDEVTVRVEGSKKLYRTIILKTSIFPTYSSEHLETAKYELKRYEYYKCGTTMYYSKICEAFEKAYNNPPGPDKFYYTLWDNAAIHFPEDTDLQDEDEVKIRLRTRRGYSVLPDIICNRCIMSDCEGCKIKEMLGHDR